MSLLQFGFERISSTTQVEQSLPEVPSHFPELHETDLGVEEHTNVLLAVSDLADPCSSSSIKRKNRGKYAIYTDEDRAKIGKYASEHGNERARKIFIKVFLNLHESTVRNFKKRYLAKLKEEHEKANPEVISSLPVKKRGRPQLLLDLDSKLLHVLRAIRNKGGVLNIHVVRATA